MFSMLVKARRLCLPIDIQCELFDKLVVPVILYGSELWGFTAFEMLEVFFRKFLKNILKLNKSTPNGMVYGEVGQLSLQTKIDQRMINYWLRLSIKNETTIAYQLYTLSLKLFSSEVFESLWLKRIKTILDSCGMSHIWHNQDNLDIKMVKSIISKRLEDTAIQKWYTSISASQMCVFYKEVKVEFGFENTYCLIILKIEFN